MRVAVLQSSYIPWKGYFDIIHDVDAFVFYDDVQYTTNDWRNRNRIKTADGVKWLTVPVGKHMHRRICDVELPSESGWIDDHLRRIETAYRQAPHFARLRSYLRCCMQDRQWRRLSDLNQALTKGIAQDWFDLRTTFLDSRDYQLSGSGSERLLRLLLAVGATEYVSGPSARAYLDERAFNDAGITVIWKDYSGYPEYAQLHGAFRHDVSIVDLLAHTGPCAAWHIWGWRHRRVGEAA